MNKDELVNSRVIATTKLQKTRLAILKSGIGIDKILELVDNYNSILSTTEPLKLKELECFINYEHTLASILYTLLRLGEDSLKAFLCNINQETKLQIESRPSNFSKTKYYFLFPSVNNEPLKIRTFNYTHGPVSYYDAIREMDFGDINLIFSHLPKQTQKLYSKDDDLLEQLDLTRKLRNYVYHHNLLFSLGKNVLERTINLLVNSIEVEELKKYFKKEINKYALTSHLDKKFQIIIH
ncbi:MAG: Abi family protein [Bacilli bacterium]|nr:Abi family protein [Bacilli bacterium]